ncbi:MAG: ECF transporter S component [Chloroflexi bacterium]|nr:MAG: ECF transporter S component [Chloroflexota bacterium]
MTFSALRNAREQLIGYLILLIISIIGLGAFVYPFFLSVIQPDDTNNVRATDAPLIFGLVMPLLLLLIVADLSSRRMNAKIVAALGILTAINAVLRFPSGIGDSPTFFFLPILLGYAYGARFGFLHGALSLFVSALITVGIGPWLPFQMLAMGWLGMGGGLLRLLRLPPDSKRELGALTVYGYVAGMLFGALMNMYFWPFQTGNSGLSWQPGLTLEQTLQRYWTFYVLSQSLPWDALRGGSTAALILMLGRPVLRELRRFYARFFWLAVPEALSQGQQQA